MALDVVEEHGEFVPAAVEKWREEEEQKLHLLLDLVVDKNPGVSEWRDGGVEAHLAGQSSSNKKKEVANQQDTQFQKKETKKLVDCFFSLLSFENL